MILKTCTKCGDDKDIDLFHNNISSKDGKKSSCIECNKLIKQNYYKANAEKIKDQVKPKTPEQKQKKATLNLKSYHKNKIKNIPKRKKYILNNKDKKRKYDTLYYTNRRLTDSVFRLKTNIRSTLNKCLKRNGYTKKSRTHDILGCSFEDFKSYLESLWKSWMSWDNYGKYNGSEGYGWDIDHIIPTSIAKTEEELISLNHYSNLQPLCSYINRNVKKDIY